MIREEKDFCEKCSIHNSCGFVIRGLEHKCEWIDIFQAGEDAMLNKVVEWLKPYNEIVDYIIDDFKKDFGI